MKKIKNWFNAPLTWKRYWLFNIVELLLTIAGVATVIAFLAGIPQKAFEAVKNKIKNLFKKS